MMQTFWDSIFNQNGSTLEEFVKVFLNLYQDGSWDEDFLQQQFWSGLEDPLAQILLLDDLDLPFIKFINRTLWVCGSSLTVEDVMPAQPETIHV